MQETRCLDGLSWTLGPGSYRVIGMLDFHMQTVMAIHQ